MMMTEGMKTDIGEIPSFLLAKPVVLLVTIFFTFICFLRLLVGRKQKKGNLPSILFGRKL